MFATPPPEWQAKASVSDLIHWAAEAFESAELYYGHGTTNALDEAAWLVSFAVGLPVDFSDADLNRPVTPEQMQKALSLAERRVKERTPVAYLTNEAWFAGLNFYVDQRVIIPRSPIAELIHERFQPWIDPERVHRVLDLCTGSGCIAIACAHMFPQASVDASDWSTDALTVARTNVEHHELTDRLRLVHSDLFDAIDRRDYDIIVSNPPYVDALDMAALPAEFAHEPEQAFAAGERGLDLVLPILAHAAEFLTDRGILVVEVGNSAEALMKALPKVPFIWLEFEHGGEGVFLLHREDLLAHKSEIEQAWSHADSTQG